jgi:NADH-quinone oxidoreductase subunit H
MFYIIPVVLKILGIVIPVLVAVAYFTLAERKFISSIQRRRGPNVVGVFGLLQPLADGLKLLLKETILPASANTIIFILSPILTFLLSLLAWVVMPLGYGMVFSDLNIGVLYLFAISSLGVYGVIIAGWSSNSKYAFLGALRSAAQMVSYEVSIGFTLVTVLICSGSLNLTSIVLCQADIWYCFPLFPVCVVFFISCLAETNRHPFDLPEAEAELVSGYNVEYSAIGFALFFLGEYANMVLISAFTVVLFFGGWLFPFPFGFLGGSFCFAVKTMVFIALFIGARAAYPRYRYDQLIRLGWKVFLPISIGWVLLTSGILLGFNWLPLFYLIKRIRLW